jgi:putative hydroxymethylpyrimidine transporter CytX
MSDTTAHALPAVSEAPLTLLEEPPRPLGLWDQVTLWGNLGITLTIPVAAAFVVQPAAGLPPLTLAAAAAAIVLGSVIGSLALAASAVPGADTGAPAMVLLRGLLGWRGSWIPTALNVAQCVGWAAVEVLVIATGASKLMPAVPRAVFVILAGAAATALAIRPLGFVRTLRRWAVWLVLAATAYLFVEVLRHAPAAAAGGRGGSWAQFWPAVDVVVALPISWAPLAADYSRHSRTRRASFLGALVGFAPAAIAYFLLGVLALAAIPAAGSDPIGALLVLPAGALAVGILVLDELDEAFANLYSTALSAQNLRPTLDRRLVAAGVGAVATGLALATDITQYENFLLVIGSVFVPLFAVLCVDYYVLHRRRWDVRVQAPLRLVMVVPWGLGFAAYQLLNPGSVPGWSDAWARARAALGPALPGWLGASITSFAVAAAATLLVAPLERRARPPAQG